MLRGRQFQVVHGPLVLLLFAAVILLTMVAFFLNAAFAFAISRPGPPQLATGFRQASDHPRIGLVLLGGDLFGLGVALLVVGLILQAGATGAVKAVKVSAKLLVGQSRPTEATSVG